MEHHGGMQDQQAPTLRSCLVHGFAGIATTLGREHDVAVVDTARRQVLGVAKKLLDRAPTRATQQSVTIQCSVVDAEELWRDAHRLSILLGDLGDVQLSGSDRYRWRLHSGPVDTTWNSRLVSDNGGLRFVGEDGNEIIVTYRPAPRHLGTEVTLRTKTPVPGLLSGALAFKVLYRARALLQTGEVPTIRHNPSARSSAR
jgi:uncharacterized membrane protein